MAITVENYIDPSTKLVSLKKKPGEVKVLDIDVSRYVRAGDTISFVVDIVATAVGNVPGASPVVVSLKTHNSAQKLQATFTGGTNLENYTISSTFVTVGGDQLEAISMLWVRSVF